MRPESELRSVWLQNLYNELSLMSLWRSLDCIFPPDWKSTKVWGPADLEWNELSGCFFVFGTTLSNLKLNTESCLLDSRTHYVPFPMTSPTTHIHTPLLSWDYPKEEGYATARALCPVHFRNNQPPYNWVVCPPGSKFHLLWVSRLWRMRYQELCRKAEDAWSLKPLFFWHHFHGVRQWGMSLTF